MRSNLSRLYIKAKAKLRKLLLFFSGYHQDVKVQIKKEKIWCGNNYGGFFIHPQGLNSESIIYSFGIGTDISFDIDIYTRYQPHIYMFDPTPASIDWIKGKSLPQKMKFYDFGIAKKTSDAFFYLPKNPEHISGSILKHANVDTLRKVKVPLKSFKDICQQLGHKHINVLKIDIEGAEYDVIESIIKADINIDQILLEFHSRFFEKGNIKTKHAIKLLNAYGYFIFAVSDSFEEVSFIKFSALHNHILKND